MENQTNEQKILKSLGLKKSSDYIEFDIDGKSYFAIYTIGSIKVKDNLFNLKAVRSIGKDRQMIIGEILT